MNKVVLMGRLTRDPEVRHTQAAEGELTITRYTLAVDRRGRSKEGEQNADFITCVCFGRQGEFAEKYFTKGLKVLITGRIQTGSYVDRDGKKVYTTDIVVEEQEFAESKAVSQSHTDGTAYGNAGQSRPTAADISPEDGFMNIPDGLEEELPFS
ncbi:MAG: single-stranded DNA-binding protein [Eubacteriales bacterium]|nr:single-stranded DNA-binding protein [Eubacteriales bacterium]